MHVHRLSITSVAAHNRSHHHELVAGHEVPYASFVLTAVTRERGQVELEGVGERGETQQERQEPEERPPVKRGSSHLEMKN